MKLANLFEPLINQDGKVVHETDEASPIVSLKDALARSLNHLQDAANPDVKYKRYRALRKLEKDDAEWTVEELALIKESVGQFPWSPWAHGYICDLIDAKTD